MQNVAKLSMVVLVAGLAAGCATNSDIDNLQSQIDGLKSSVAQASSDAASAQSAANDAAARAAAAEAAANRAAQYAQDTSAKLDRMFEKTMRK